MNTEPQNHGCRRGFTLIEVMVASTIIGLVIAGTLAVFLMGLRTWHEESIQNELNTNCELAMARLRIDLRLSSMAGNADMAFFPTTGDVYTAISMPLALDDGMTLSGYDAAQDGDDLLERDATGKILWDQTVIYHVYDDDPDLLIRTVFAPKDTNASIDQIQAQLEAVVGGATTGACLNGEVHSSEVLFRNVVNMKFIPIPTEFDGYATSIEKENSFNFGSVAIDSGNHNLLLECVGKNTNSTGYKLGIDGFEMTASDSYREGEYYLTISNAYPYWSSGYSNGTASVTSMVSVGLYRWSEESQLLFEPNGSPPTNAAIYFNVYNDFWLDTSFDVVAGSYTEDTEVFEQGDTNMVHALRGTNWNVQGSVAGVVTAATDYACLPGTNVVVAIWGEWEEFGADKEIGHDNIAHGGRYVRFMIAGPPAAYTNKTFKFSGLRVFRDNLSTNATLTFTDAWGSDPDLIWTAAGAGAGVIKAGGEVWTDWIDMEINEENTYAVGFTVDGDPDDACTTYWAGTVTNSELNLTVESTNVYAVRMMEVHYPDHALYRSGIFDTGMADPAYANLRWRYIERNGSGQDYYVFGGTRKGDIDIKLRVGDDQGMTDGIWKPGVLPYDDSHYYSGGIQYPNQNISTIPSGRYIQHQTLFTTSGDEDDRQTGDLWDLMIDWPGPEGLVDLSMDLTKGPDYGIYTAKVDGRQLARGIRVEMTIFKVFPFVDRTKTATSTMSIIPLNTGK